MTQRRRFLGLLICTVMLAGGAGLLYAWTQGFTAFTSYSYALDEAGPLPRPAPSILFIDQFGSERSLESLRGRYVLLHAFYGDCFTVCPMVMERLRETYAGLTDAQRNKLVILSITVDPERDSTERLRELWRHEGAVKGWIVAQPAGNSFDAVGRAFGIWVLARDDGIINHSADLFLIDPEGRIEEVISPQLQGDWMRNALESYL